MHNPSGLKIDIVVKKKSEHAIEEFHRRRKVEFWEGCKVNVATPEDVILKKLVYYREGQSEKHLRDIRGILAQTSIDRSYLEKWIAKLRLEVEWELI